MPRTCLHGALSQSYRTARRTVRRFQNSERLPFRSEAACPASAALLGRPADTVEATGGVLDDPAEFPERVALCVTHAESAWIDQFHQGTLLCARRLRLPAEQNDGGAAQQANLDLSEGRERPHARRLACRSRSCAADHCVARHGLVVS